jgi:hypothetical protein
LGICISCVEPYKWTVVGCVNGHSEYWKWYDSRTIEVTEMDYNQWQGFGRLSSMALQPSNEDLHKVQRGAWGKLGYIPSQKT